MSLSPNLNSKANSPNKKQNNVGQNQIYNTSTKMNLNSSDNSSESESQNHTQITQTTGPYYNYHYGNQNLNYNMAPQSQYHPGQIHPGPGAALITPYHNITANDHDPFKSSLSWSTALFISNIIFTILWYLAMSGVFCGVLAHLCCLDCINTCTSPCKDEEQKREADERLQAKADSYNRWLALWYLVEGTYILSCFLEGFINHCLRKMKSSNERKVMRVVRANQANGAKESNENTANGNSTNSANHITETITDETAFCNPGVFRVIRNRVYSYYPSVQNTMNTLYHLSIVSLINEIIIRYLIILKIVVFDTLQPLFRAASAPYSMKNPVRMVNPWPNVIFYAVILIIIVTIHPVLSAYFHYYGLLRKCGDAIKESETKSNGSSKDKDYYETKREYKIRKHQEERNNLI